MQPLKGITVLDLSRVLAGPYCTAMLADLGAEVVKVESGQGDDSRHIAPYVEGESLYFSMLNRGKKSLCLNLKDPQDLEIKVLQDQDIKVHQVKDLRLR